MRSSIPTQSSRTSRLQRMLSEILGSSNQEAKLAVTLIITAAHKSIPKVKTGVKQVR